MQKNNDQQNAAWDEAIAKVDPWYAERLRSRQDDGDMRSLDLLIEQLAQPPSVWAKLRSMLGRLRKRIAKYAISA